jgi:hypothetical protein
MRHTLPVSPYIHDLRIRHQVARALWYVWTNQHHTLTPPQRTSWAVGYHVRNAAAQDLANRGQIEAARQLHAVPMFRGRPATLTEARELATDGRLP